MNACISKLGKVLVARRWKASVMASASGEMEGLGTKRYADGSVYEGEGSSWANHKAAGAVSGHESHSSAALAFVM